MKKGYTVLAVVSLLLILATILAGFFLLPQIDTAQTDEFTIAPPHLIGPASSTQAASPEFFTFGDQSDRVIFLRLTNPDLADTAQFTLVGSTPGPEATPAEAGRCSLGVGFVAPPAGVSVSVNNVASESSLGQLKSWLSTPVNNQYAVMMWSPDSQVSDYHLLSATAPQVSNGCAQFNDEGV